MQASSVQMRSPRSSYKALDTWMLPSNFQKTHMHNMCTHTHTHAHTHKHTHTYIVGKECQAYDIIISTNFFDTIQVSHIKYL